jgi:hypothetical protein
MQCGAYEMVKRELHSAWVALDQKAEITNGLRLKLARGQLVPAAAARPRYSHTVLGATPGSCAMDLALAPAPKCIISNCLIRRMDSLDLGIPPLHRLRWRY